MLKSLIPILPLIMCPLMMLAMGGLGWVATKLRRTASARPQHEDLAHRA